MVPPDTFIRDAGLLSEVIPIPPPNPARLPDISPPDIVSVEFQSKMPPPEPPE